MRIRRPAPVMRRKERGKGGSYVEVLSLGGEGLPRGLPFYVFRGNGGVSGAVLIPLRDGRGGSVTP